MKTLPTQLEAERHSLNPPEITTLVELVIEDPDANPIAIRFSDKQTLEWDGKTWSKSPFKILGISNSSSGERNRPSLTLPNEGGAYSYYLNQGLLEDSLVTRYRVMLIEGVPHLASKNVFYVSHPSNISGALLTLELRRMSEGNKFKIPPNRYIQPEFKTVIL